MSPVAIIALIQALLPLILKLGPQVVELIQELETLFKSGQKPSPAQVASVLGKAASVAQQYADSHKQVA